MLDHTGTPVNRYSVGKRRAGSRLRYGLNWSRHSTFTPNSALCHSGRLIDGHQCYCINAIKEWKHLRIINRMVSYSSVQIDVLLISPWFQQEKWAAKRVSSWNRLGCLNGEGHGAYGRGAVHPGEGFSMHCTQGWHSQQPKLFLSSICLYKLWPGVPFPSALEQPDIGQGTPAPKMHRLAASWHV